MVNGLNFAIPIPPTHDLNKPLILTFHLQPQEKQEGTPPKPLVDRVQEMITFSNAFRVISTICTIYQSVTTLKSIANTASYYLPSNLKIST